MRRVCVVVGSRANYSSIKSVLTAVQAEPALELQLVVGASAVLDRYGAVADLIESDGFRAIERVNMIVEGETPVTMAQSTGLGLLALPTVFERLRPDVVVTVGDRFETVATTVAAAYMNIPIAHTMGGEITGSIDESIRHAVTKFSHLHFPASAGARERILRLGEPEERVHLVGCPRVDLVAQLVDQPFDEADMRELEGGVGAAFKPANPFVLVSQHPVTSEYGAGEAQINATLQAVAKLGLPAVVLWPNADAGSEDVARGIRKWRERRGDSQMRFYKNLPIATYVKLMSRASCLLGNSSSGVREGAYIGTPVVNIGTRQEGRDWGSNVIDVGHATEGILEAAEVQARRGRYSMDTTYGDGGAGPRIAAVLRDIESIPTQKRITY